jgi:aldose 1-epimerase
MSRTAVERFGFLGAAPVERITISAHGLTARVLSWGAVLQDLRLDGHPHPLVLGFPDFDPYPAHTQNFGAIVGRVANRIAWGSAPVGGRVAELDRNYRDRHTLHGGRDGAGRRLWHVAEAGGDAATLALHLPDGHMGFPGALQARCAYRVRPGPALEIEITATTDAPTLCGFAQHGYFNLDGTASVLDHMLRVDAETYLEADADLIPTGARRPVAGTPFDFRDPRPVRHGDARYDHNFCLGECRQALREVAVLSGPESGITMTVETTEPGLQVYDGARTATGAVPGLAGASYGPFAGIALEPQCWPDAPNRPWAHQVQLAPGGEYRQVSVFRFESRA